MKSIVLFRYGILFFIAVILFIFLLSKYNKNEEQKLIDYEELKFNIEFVKYRFGKYRIYYYLTNVEFVTLLLKINLL